MSSEKSESTWQLPEGRRIHDEKVYLTEDRTSEPKEVFKLIGSMLQQYAAGTGPVSLLDIGSATGEFLHFAAKQFPGWDLTGLDVSEKMLTEAARKVPSARFIQGSVLDRTYFSRPRFDVITCMGVLSIFDSLEEPVTNMIATLKPKGLLIIFGMMNEYAVDVLVRCRYADAPDQPWQIGYNAFSREYYERVLQQQGKHLTWSWQKFKLSIDLPKRDDLLRNWTICTESDPHQQVRGTSQLSSQFILQVRLAG
jgi:ubiquinone/menaquinone biosynthesis C-methylase UbiE